VAAQLGSRAAPRAVLDHRLLGRGSLWRQWFAASGLTDVELDRRPRANYQIDQFHITAAIEGHGIALASPHLFARELESGRLIRPFALEIADDGHDYWLVYPTARRHAPKLVAFRTWILAEARACLGAAPPPVPRRRGRP
jgi:LysR family glycine cleavage system transcriptional activator